MEKVRLRHLTKYITGSEKTADLANKADGGRSLEVIGNDTAQEFMY